MAMSTGLCSVELFAGAGGLSIGLERAGFSVLMANEIEKDFAASFSMNHPKGHHHGKQAL